MTTISGMKINEMAKRIDQQLKDNFQMMRIETSRQLLIMMTDSKDNGGYGLSMKEAVSVFDNFFEVARISKRQICYNNIRMVFGKKCNVLFVDFDAFMVVLKSWLAKRAEERIAKLIAEKKAKEEAQKVEAAKQNESDYFDSTPVIQQVIIPNKVETIYDVIRSKINN